MENLKLNNETINFRADILDHVVDFDLQGLVGISSDFTNSGSGRVNEQNISGLPGAYLTVYGDASKLADRQITGKWDAVECVIREDNFVGSDGNSLAAVERTILLGGHGHDRYVLENYSARQGGATYQLFDLDHGVFADNVFKGIIYTKKSLEACRPVVFAVNSTPINTTENWDGSTNNYLTIVGMGNDGRNYFLAWDNATPHRDAHILNDVEYAGGISPLNKLYLDEHWSGLLRADGQWKNTYSSVRQTYRITQIIRTKTVK